MADYIYLLQTRLNAAQRSALDRVREAARERAMTVFLVGGAVRDLTSGAPIRDLDLAVQGNALKLAKDLQKFGTLVGTNDPLQAAYFNFPGGVRLAVESTLSITYPKPGKPVAKPATILEDLRRRDFTANAMALSLNEGSFGLLMDPLNGVADIENRELRLVSNYGFIEDPVRMIRAARFIARQGWQMEEKTQGRYETGKTEGYLSAMSPAQAGYELEEVFHEEDPLRVMRKLEAEGWAKSLSPIWSSGKANEAELERLRDTLAQLESMGIQPDPSPAYFPLLTAKLNPKEVAALKQSFARPGFVTQVEALDAETKTFGTAFSGKAAALPSDSWKMLLTAVPENVLWLAFTSKNAGIQAKFKAFVNDWPQARQKIPYQLMQEMRITPELPGYADLLENLFFAMMDAKIETPEAIRAFLEPFSPPAPPPPVNLRRRAVKKEAKAPRSKKAKAAAAPEVEDDVSTEVTEAAAAPPPPAAPIAESAPVEKVPAAKPAKPAPAKAVAAKGAAPAAKAAAKPALPAKTTAKAPSAKAAAARPVSKAVKSTPAKAAAPTKGKPTAKGEKKAPTPAKKTAAKKTPAKAAAKGRATPAKVPAKKAAAAKKAAPAKAKPAPAKKPAGKPKAAAKKAVPAKKAAKKQAKR